MTRRQRALRHRAAQLPLPARGGARRRSLPERLAAALRERILAGELAGGSLLRQEAVAGRYGVSRIPVREALRLLAGEGLVRLQTHRGAVVSSHSAEEIGELFDLRAMLERDLVRRAALRATPADVARAARVLQRLERAYRREDPNAWGSLNTEFHRLLMAPAQRPQTLALAQSVALVTERSIRLYHRIFTGFARAQADHRRILRLFRSRRGAEAAAAIARHVHFTRRTLLRELEARTGTEAGGSASRSPPRRPRP